MCSPSPESEGMYESVHCQSNARYPAEVQRKSWQNAFKIGVFLDREAVIMY
jgi:hypothetical protein